MVIRHHLFRATTDSAGFNKQLTQGDYHIFSTSSSYNGTPEECKKVFEALNLSLIYQSPECWSANHPERNYPSMTLWVFKTKESAEQ